MQLQLDVRRNCHGCTRISCPIRRHFNPATSIHVRALGYLCGADDKRTPGSSDDILVAVANCCRRFETVEGDDAADRAPGQP